jgi:hypothetical protein
MDGERHRLHLPSLKQVVLGAPAAERAVDHCSDSDGSDK